MRGVYSKGRFSSFIIFFRIFVSALVLVLSATVSAAQIFNCNFFSVSLDGWHVQSEPAVRRRAFVVGFAENAGRAGLTVHIVRSEKSAKQTAQATVRFFRERGVEVYDLGSDGEIYGFSASDGAGKLVSVLIKSDGEYVATIYLHGDFNRAVAFFTSFKNASSVLPLPTEIKD